MNIKAINLADGEQIETVDVRITKAEAVYLATLLGNQRGTDADQTMRGGAELNREIYGTLSGGVFNRFYEGGVDEALRKQERS